MADAITVETALENAVSASFQVTPNDHAPEGAEVMGGVVYKGTVTKDGKEKTMYQAVINGVEGKIKAGFTPAIQDAITSTNNVPANYDKPSKWTDVAPKNEADPEPESVDDLEDAEAYKTAYAQLAEAAGAETTSRMEMRKVAFANAGVMHSVRSQFADKKKWSYFKKFAPAEVLDMISNANSVSEMSKAGAILGHDGFDADTMLSAGVSSAKGIMREYQTMLNAVAGNVVKVLKSPKGRKAVDLKGKVSDADGCIHIINAMIEDGVYSITEAGDQVELSPEGHAMADALIGDHVEGWGEGTEAFAYNDGKAVPAKAENGEWLFAALFGHEGADELVSALARAINNYTVVADAASLKAAEEETLGDLAAEVKASKTPFSGWDQEKAAAHLAKILLSRYDVDGTVDEREAQASDIDGILELMSQWVERIVEEEATLEDILSDGNDSEEDAEDEADAG